ncbi:MAG: Na+/H+ antiporter NhaA [Myxococcota bacterium]
MPLPRTPAQRLSRPFVRFTEVEASSGLVLVACTALALWLANSDWLAFYHRVLELEIGVSIGGLHPALTLHELVNDGLMTIFFFVVGLEIKREFVSGELHEPRKAALPIAAALGGMLAPAGIYLAFQFGEPGHNGWGIPMATDIAFVVGVMALLGSRMPHGLKVMLLALAIVDDIGAVVVIAVGYSAGLSAPGLAASAVGFGLVALLNRIGVRAIGVYAVLGVGIWLTFMQSGVHSTVAGVLLGLMTPAAPWVPHEGFFEHCRQVSSRLLGGPRNGEQYAVLLRLARASRETVPPLERLERALHPWVAFGIMPLFALANAGVRIQPGDLGSPVEMAVMLGLLLGKPIGIVSFSWVFVRMGFAALPDRVDWPAMVGAGFLGGIGFTMALFIASLALGGELLESAKVGILSGSLLSAVVGSIVLLVVLRRKGESVPSERAVGAAAPASGGAEGGS